MKRNPVLGPARLKTGFFQYNKKRSRLTDIENKLVVMGVGGAYRGGGDGRYKLLGVR